MYLIQIVLLITLIGIIAFAVAVARAARGDDDRRRRGGGRG